VIVCTGAATAVGQAFNAVDRKGVVLFFAIPDKDIMVPTADFWRNEITITSSYGAAPADLKAALAMLRNKKIKIKELITHYLPLQDIQKGYNIISEGKKAIKVVLEPN
jgi:L-iditol 2-dehydrogenase